MSTHQCPRRGCLIAVPNALFACLPDWHALPLPVRRAISRTVRLNVLAEPRRAAFAAARDAWDELDTLKSGQ
jgi:hypothetical protein